MYETRLQCYSLSLTGQQLRYSTDCTDTSKLAEIYLCMEESIEMSRVQVHGMNLIALHGIYVVIEI